MSGSKRFTGGQVVLALVALAAFVGATGCAEVRPYERAQLAHPTMAADDAFTSGIANHVQAISEGGTGGLSAGGGGCGCN